MDVIYVDVASCGCYVDVIYVDVVSCGCHLCGCYLGGCNLCGCSIMWLLCGCHLCGCSVMWMLGGCNLCGCSVILASCASGCYVDVMSLLSHRDHSLVGIVAGSVTRAGRCRG